jgi:hypothetical protein
MMFRHSLFLLLALASFLLFSANDPDIRQLMTTEEFAASGLGGLSEVEIGVINRWLVRYIAEDVAKVFDTSPAVREVDEAGVSGRVDDQFSGWNGATQFRLKNGQV